MASLVGDNSNGDLDVRPTNSQDLFESQNFVNSVPHWGDVIVSSDVSVHLRNHELNELASQPCSVVNDNGLVGSPVEKLACLWCFSLCYSSSDDSLSDFQIFSIR